ncbi:MAG: MBL fold metallo-hydrolase [Granulosicoccus sp.]
MNTEANMKSVSAVSDTLQKSNKIINQTIRVKSGSDLVNYCYLVVNRETNQAIVIDPAWEIEKIRSILSTRKCELTSILLTHHHKDHTNLANELAIETGATVYMSSREIEHYEFSCSNLVPIENNNIQSAGMDIKVIDTPGHTAGSVCFSISDYLFTGDTLFIEGCGVCKGWGSSANHLFESLLLIKNMFSDKTKIFPGHRFNQSPGKSLEYVKENNIYLQVQEKTEFVNLHMRERDTSNIQYR